MSSIGKGHGKQTGGAQTGTSNEKNVPGGPEGEGKHFRLCLKI